MVQQVSQTTLLVRTLYNSSIDTSTKHVSMVRDHLRVLAVNAVPGKPYLSQCYYNTLISPKFFT